MGLPRGQSVENVQELEREKKTKMEELAQIREKHENELIKQKLEIQILHQDQLVALQYKYSAKTQALLERIEMLVEREAK